MEGNGNTIDNDNSNNSGNDKDVVSNKDSNNNMKVT